jgi:hypothetical protein
MYQYPACLHTRQTVNEYKGYFIAGFDLKPEKPAIAAFPKPV